MYWRGYPCSIIYQCYPSTSRKRCIPYCYIGIICYPLLLSYCLGGCCIITNGQGKKFVYYVLDIMSTQISNIYFSGIDYRILWMCKGKGCSYIHISRKRCHRSVCILIPSLWTDHVWNNCWMWWSILAVKQGTWSHQKWNGISNGHGVFRIGISTYLFEHFIQWGCYWCQVKGAFAFGSILYLCWHCQWFRFKTKAHKVKEGVNIMYLLGIIQRKEEVFVKERERDRVKVM